MKGFNYEWLENRLSIPAILAETLEVFTNSCMSVHL